MRLRLALHWILLCANMLLFVFVLLILLVIWGWPRLNKAARVADHDAAILGQAVYCARGPFSLLVAKDFPADESFTLIQHARQPLDISVDDLGAGGVGRRKRVHLGLGERFAVSVEYSESSSEGCRFDMLQLTRLGEKRSDTFFDYRVDGSFDYRIVRDLQGRVGQHCVFYQGRWQEVLGADRDPKQDQFHKQLLDGTPVSFDTQSGQWLSSTEKPAASGAGQVARPETQ